jgi:VIT1/CCC1 family predicted Fe2+/Mn2+ transporter
MRSCLADSVPAVRTARHVEQHFTGSDTVRDVVIGMSDGLTVPFALAAGLTGAIATTGIIVTAGLAEIAAGSIAMGLGGYLAAKSDAEHFESELKREELEIVEKPAAEMQEITDLFSEYGLSSAESQPVVQALSTRPQAWRDFMMKFELGLERPDPRRSLRSALTIAGSYALGGFVPLTSYILMQNPTRALIVSAAVTLTALVIFGFVKGRFTGARPIRSALQTAAIGTVAAGAAFAIARLIG